MPASLRTLVRVSLPLAIACACLPAWTGAATYAEKRAAALKRCEAIDANAGQTGLIGNPDGYRSFYLRSECFQKTAVEFRDESLCGQVKERRSIFFSSWGYSDAQCRRLVAMGVADDQRTLDEMKARYVASGMRLRDFRIDRNGNGRDFDIVPIFDGEHGQGYSLRFEILRGEVAPVLLHADGYYVDPRSALSIYVRQGDIRQRLAEFATGRAYSVRATATLDIGTGRGQTNWSDAFVARVFPVSDRSTSVIKEVRF